MLKFGDEVIWLSQGGGYTSTKIGTVAATVPAGVDPKALHFLKAGDGASWPRMFDGGPRTELSYLVLVFVEKTSGLSPVLYWPRTRNLRIANTE